MRYGVQHLNRDGDVIRMRVFHAAKTAIARAPWILCYGNRKPNPDQWRVVRLGGTLDAPIAEEVIATSDGDDDGRRRGGANDVRTG